MHDILDERLKCELVLNEGAWAAQGGLGRLREAY